MSFSAPLLWSSAFYENCPQLQYNRNQCFWWETCNKINWTSSVLNLMFTVNYCVPLTLDTEWMNLICLLIWNVHSEWTDCPSGLQLNNFLDDSKIETVQPGFTSGRSVCSCGLTHQHMCDKYTCLCIGLFVRLSLYQFICVSACVHVCVLHTHASSTSRLKPIWFALKELVELQRPGPGQQRLPLTYT